MFVGILETNNLSLKYIMNRVPGRNLHPYRTRLLVAQFSHCTPSLRLQYAFGSQLPLAPTPLPLIEY